MSKAEDHLQPDPELQAPKGLADDLSALFGPATPVPPEVDEAVSAMARGHLSRKSSFRRHFRWSAVAAAAAAVLLFAWTASLFEREAAPAAKSSPRPPSVAPSESATAGLPSRAEEPKALRPVLEGDVNGDGRVDILDAFALAKQVELVNALKPEWDFNHDGVVDRKDAEAIARTAVKLDTHPPHALKPAGG